MWALRASAMRRAIVLEAAVHHCWARNMTRGPMATKRGWVGLTWAGWVGLGGFNATSDDLLQGVGDGVVAIKVAVTVAL